MYRIGELAKACGVKADTLRFYEKNGLISPGIRNESGYRLYGEQDKRRLEFIIRAKSVGFSLADIGELLALDALNREESCGGHFREESQTEENEAKRDDVNFSHVAVWEYKGQGTAPVLHKEPLTFENVTPSQRSYK